MPEIFRSLLIVLVIASMVFAVAKKPMLALGVSLQDFTLRRNAWFGITLAAFLSHNFWIFAVITAVILRMGAKRDSNTMAFVFAILFAVPLFASEISGFGVVNYFFGVTYFRLISLFVLLPFFLKKVSEPDDSAGIRKVSDVLLISYLSVIFFLQIQGDTLTNTLRTSFYSFVDIYLPYYVASRYFKSMHQLREVLCAFVLATLLVGAIGIFEFAKGWLLYSAMPDALDATWGFGRYLARGTSLRALATTGQPIVLGYLLAVGIGFYLAFNQDISQKFIRVLLLLCLVGGLIAPLSRGPWIGCVVIVFVFIITGPNVLQNMVRWAFPAALGFMAVLVSPYGEKVMDLLPFVGKVDIENVVYRERLLTNSLEVIARNPFFGSSQFLYAPEFQDMLSGGSDGIVDLVNSYLGLALSGGLVSLALFVGVFVWIAWNVYFVMRGIADHADSQKIIGRSIFAVLLGILVIIYTVSSITFVPIVYWLVAGLGFSYIKLVKNSQTPVT